MAGAGYKLFNTGDVLTAAQVNTYLQEQTVMVFASSTARTTALSGVLAEGMVSYLQDTNAVEVYNGSAWVGVSGAGDVTEVQAGTGISVASGAGPIPVVTNTMATAIDAEGDLIIGDAADAFQRLAIGSNTHVLTVDTSVDGKIKWAAPASGALTLIQRSSFSNVANTGTTFDGLFSSTYGSYIVVFESIYAATSSDDLHFQFRYAGPNTQTAAYYGNTISFVHTGTTITNTAQSNVAQMTVSATIGSSAEPGRGSMTLYGLSGLSAEPSVASTFADGGTGGTSNTFIQQLTARIYTGFILKSSSTNITGTVSIYGLA